MKTILVCGSRDWIDKDIIREALPFAIEKIKIIHGGAKGADRLAGEIAKELGFEVVIFYPDWTKYGKAAGFKRNIQMLQENPDEVIAFWDGQSRGTKHTIDSAKKMNIPVTIWYDYDDTLARETLRDFYRKR